MANAQKPMAMTAGAPPAATAEQALQGKLADILNWVMDNASKIDEAEAEAILAKVHEATTAIENKDWLKAALALRAAYKLYQKAIAN